MLKPNKCVQLTVVMYKDQNVCFPRDITATIWTSAKHQLPFAVCVFIAKQISFNVLTSVPIFVLQSKKI